MFKRYKKVRKLWKIIDQTEVGVLSKGDLYQKENNQYDRIVEVNQILDDMTYSKLKRLTTGGRLYSR